MLKNRALQYTRQKLTELQGETDVLIIIAGDFNTPLLEMDRSNRQKINKDLVELDTINHTNITDIYRLFNKGKIFSQVHMHINKDRPHSGP